MSNVENSPDSEALCGGVGTNPEAQDLICTPPEIMDLVSDVGISPESWVFP